MSPRDMYARQRGVAVVTGASSGIGEATARALAAVGYEVVCAARRVDRIGALAAGIGGRAVPLDVRDDASVAALAAAVPACHLLVNNAGLALTLDPVAQGREDDWRTVLETNVLGLMAVTKALLPALERSAPSHIINLGSVAGIETYPGGGAYTASKHAVRAITGTLRLELNGKPIRVSEVLPGLVETEFSLVRFGGDAHRAAKTYDGLTPLAAADIADCIVWLATRPAHVNIDSMVVKPVAQATAMISARFFHETTS